MARTVHAAGLRERQRMREHDTSGKWDVGYVDDGTWVHVCRYSSEEEARDAVERLDDPSDEARNLIGLDGSEEMEARPAP